MPASHLGDNPGLESIFGLTADSGGLSLAAIRRRAKRQLSKFDTLVRGQLAERGVSIPPIIDLISSQDTQVALDGDHPQRPLLTQWLDSNIKLKKNFKEIEVLFEMVRAAETPGQVYPPSSRFHIGLTSAGPVAYFQELRDSTQGNA